MYHVLEMEKLTLRELQSKLVMKLGCELALACLNHNILFRTQHIPGVDNHIAVLFHVFSSCPAYVPTTHLGTGMSVVKQMPSSGPALYKASYFPQKWKDVCLRCFLFRTIQSYICITNVLYPVPVNRVIQYVAHLSQQKLYHDYMFGWQPTGCQCKRLGLVDTTQESKPSISLKIMVDQCFACDLSLTF